MFHNKVSPKSTVERVLSLHNPKLAEVRVKGDRFAAKETFAWRLADCEECVTLQATSPLSSQLDPAVPSMCVLFPSSSTSFTIASRASRELIVSWAPGAASKTTNMAVTATLTAGMFATTDQHRF